MSAVRVWSGMCGSSAASPYNWTDENGKPVYRCNVCNDRRYVESMIPCPEGNEGCLVAHFEVERCPRCNRTRWQRIKRFFRRGTAPPVRQFNFCELGDTIVIPGSTLVDSLHVYGGTVKMAEPIDLNRLAISNKFEGEIGEPKVTFTNTAPTHLIDNFQADQPPPWILFAAQEIEEHVRAKCNRYVMHANEIAAIIARHLPPAP